MAGRPVALGKAEWAGVTGAPRWARTARRMAQVDGALTVFVAVDGGPAGVLVLDDPLRPDAARTIRALRRGGIERIVMVTGDRAEVAETVGAVIGVDEVLAEQTPAEKLDAVRRSAGGRPRSWSATASTTRRRWPSQTSGSPWGPVARRRHRKPPTSS